MILAVLQVRNDESPSDQNQHVSVHCDYVAELCDDQGQSHRGLDASKSLEGVEGSTLTSPESHYYTYCDGTV